MGTARHGGQVPVRQAGVVSDAFDPGPPRPPTPPAVSEATAGAAYVPSVPLGGVAPAPEEQPARTSRRDLVVAAVLLVTAVLAGAASLLPWRDYGRVVGPAVAETGWSRPDGSMGRGWLAVLVGMLLASAGVAIAAEHERAGRVMAAVVGTATMVFAVAEWGLGAGQVRSGPGAGLWLLFMVGLASVVVVGTVGPARPTVGRDPGTARLPRRRAYSSDG